MNHTLAICDNRIITLLFWLNNFQIKSLKHRFYTLFSFSKQLQVIVTAEDKEESLQYSLTDKKVKYANYTIKVYDACNMDDKKQKLGERNQETKTTNVIWTELTETKGKNIIECTNTEDKDKFPGLVLAVVGDCDSYVPRPWNTTAFTTGLLNTVHGVNSKILVFYLRVFVNTEPVSIICIQRCVSVQFYFLF